MAIEREDLVLPQEIDPQNVDRDRINITSRTPQDDEKNKIPRVMKTFEEEEKARVDGSKFKSPESVKEINYKYGSQNKDIQLSRENQDARINQLLLRDISHDTEDTNLNSSKNNNSKKKSRTHPYNKNRLGNTQDRPSSLNKNPNMKDVSSLNKIDMDLVPDNNKNNNSKPFYRTSLGDWVFQETVGAGSMGKVKLAKHCYTGELCAIKVVNRATKNFLRKQQNLPNPRNKEEVQEREKKLQKEISRDKRTIREASLGQIMDHPNICKLYEMCTLSNHFYMVFEYISGGQLLDYIIQHGSLRESMARKIARSIAGALQYLHANNIVHRDLKIENVMISKDGEIKLIDFGLSNLYNRTKRLHTFCGSLYFAAPELLRAKPYVGPEIDIWSFGVILYVLVCGKVPFDDENSSVLHEKIKRGRVNYPSFLSIEVISLLTRMLVVDPLTRATLKEVVNHHWMVRGYDGDIAPSHLHWRKPLTPSTIENKVLNEMYHLEFIDDVAQTRKMLIDIIKSEDYIEKSKEHDNLFRLAQSPRKEIDINIGFCDPTIAYHPIISLYYLTSEWLNKKSHSESDSTRTNKVPTDLSHVGEDKIETKSEPLLKEPAKDMVNKNVKYQTTEINQQDTNNTKNKTQLQQNGNILLPPKLTTKAKVCNSPTRKNHFDPSDNAIPTINSLKNKNASNNHNHNHNSPTMSNHDKNKISNLLRRFSVKIPSTSPNGDTDGPTNLTASNAQKQHFAEHLNNMKKGLEFQKKHTRTMSENDSAAMNLLNIFNNNTGKERDNVDYNATHTNKENIGPSKPISHKRSPTESHSKDIHDDESYNYNHRPKTSNNEFNNTVPPKNRTMSVGHPRRESLKFLRPVLQNNENAIDSNVFLESPQTENGESFDRHASMRHDDILSVVNSPSYYNQADLTDAEIIEDAKHAPLGSMPSIDFPRSLFLKGFFSVQTTSSKPLPIVRFKIIKVLQEMNIQFKEVKGGFLCTYEIPVINKKTVHDEQLLQDLSSIKTIRDQSRPSVFDNDSIEQYPINLDNGPNVSDSKSVDLTKRSTIKSDQKKSEEMIYDQSTPTRQTSHRKEGAMSDKVSIIDSTPSDSRKGGPISGESSSALLLGNTSNQVSPTTTDSVKVEIIEKSVIKFEIHIVKVKIINLAGIHFKKVSGNPWIYKDIASKILSSLKL